MRLFKRRIDLHKLSTCLFLTTIFLIPFQKYFFLNSKHSFLDGYLITYNSFYITTLEVIIIFLITVNIKIILKLLNSYLSNFINLISFLLFLITAAGAILFSINPIISFHKIIHLIIWFSWGILGFHYLLHKTIFVKSLAILSLSTSFQALLVFYQFIKQKSLGLSWLGESVISPSILGVAKIDFLGQKIVRAYGTFSHPNILGAFLVFSVVCCLLIINKKVAASCSQDCSTWNNLKKNNSLLFAVEIFFLILSLTMTFSRSSFVGLLILLIAAIAMGNDFIKKISSLALLFFLLMGFVFLPLIQSRIKERQVSNNSSQTLRSIYIQKARGNIVQHPLFGTGPGTFVLTLQEEKDISLNPWELQPVHNIYLLIVSDFGLPFFCVIAFLLTHPLFFFLKRACGSLDFLLIILLFVYLIIGFFDHFMYSFSTGIAMMTLLLAKIFSSYSLAQTDCSTWNNQEENKDDSLFHVEQSAPINNVPRGTIRTNQ